MTNNTIDINLSYYTGPAILHFGEYSNGDSSIQIFDINGELLTVATVNLDSYGIVPDSGNVIIKHYSENAGLLEALEEAGVIKERVQSFSFGFVLNGATEVVLTEKYAI